MNVFERMSDLGILLVGILLYIVIKGEGIFYLCICILTFRIQIKCPFPSVLFRRPEILLNQKKINFRIIWGSGLGWRKWTSDFYRAKIPVQYIFSLLNSCSEKSKWIYKMLCITRNKS